jgi:hypothetical protein
VEFRRTDGRNRPGVDVPFGFDGGLARTIQPGSSASVSFEVVRHQSKFEPPLSSMVGIGGFGYLSTIVEVTIYGRDQNGNEVSTVASMDVHFADFAGSDES